MLGWQEEYREILDRIESELRRLDMWADQPPAMSAFTSTLPFCVDTMPLENWLQFVLIPKVESLLALDRTLPGPAGIAPIAEEAFKHNHEALRLVRVLHEFDELTKRGSCH